MRTTGDFLNSARSKIGIHESPWHSNMTPVGVEFGWNGVPWCAELASVCATEAGFGLHTASSGQIEAWAKQGVLGMTWHTSGYRAGDIFIFGGGEHSGIVEYVGAGWVTEIDGNWSDSVVRRQQSLSSSWLTGAARLPFSAIPSVPPTPTSKWGPTVVKTPGVLQPSDHGQVVASLQIRCNHIADAYRVHISREKVPVVPYDIKVDGVYGNNTGSMVKWVQRRGMLTDTGIADATFMAKLAQLERNFGIVYG